MFRGTDQQQLSSATDEALVDYIRQGRAASRVALNELLRRHHEALLQRCHRYLKNRQDAEDAVQETELRMIRALNAFKGESAFRTWLFAIADNQCHTLAVRRMRNIMSEHFRALLEVAQVGRETTAQDQQELASWANCVLTALPAQAAEILSLRFYADLGIEDIAHILGIGLSAAKMRLYRSLRQAETLLPEMDQRMLIRG